MYREQTRTCPACRVPMEAAELAVEGERVQVEVCNRCQGVFADYFDGDPRAIAGLFEGSHGGQSAPVAGKLECAACGTPMVSLAYLGDGPELLRCGSCGAAFLTSEAMARLASYTESLTTTPDLLGRIVQWWRSL